MNDLEERLRAALDARAGTYEASPDAWMSVQRRLRRPGRAWRGWLLAAAAVAAIALLVPFLLTKGLNRQVAGTPEDAYRQAMEHRSPYGEQLTLDNPTEGRPLRLWFARNAVGATEVCSLVEPQAREPFANCHLGTEMGSRYDHAWAEGSTARDGSDVIMDYGVATDRVTSVTALAKDGRRIEGAVQRPAGAPLGFWSVTFSPADQVTKLEFTGPKLDEPYAYNRTRLFMGAPGASLGSSLAMPGGLEARPYADAKDPKAGPILVWTRGGREVSRHTLNPAFLLKDAPVQFNDREGAVQGIARKDLASIAIVTPKGTVTAPTTPDPWNYGIRLFSTPVAEQIDWAAGGSTIAYDEAGKEIWRRDSPAESPDEIGRRVGDVLTVPGTDDFPDGPVKLWFAGGSDNTMICNSGGLAPGGQRTGGCGNAGTDANSFSWNTLRSFLPDPGTVVAYGAMKDGWEAAAAVTPDGRRIPATLYQPKGAPYRIWTVTHSGDVTVAALVFRTKGSEVEDLYLADAAACWGDKRPAGNGQQLAQDVTVYVSQEPGCVLWWKGKEHRSFDRMPGAKISALVGPGRPVRWSIIKRSWFGFATQETARVEVMLKDGARVSADTVPDAWGEGVAMFAASVPSPDMAELTEIAGYGRDGKELWRYDPSKYLGR